MSFSSPLPYQQQYPFANSKQPWKPQPPFYSLWPSTRTAYTPSTQQRSINLSNSQNPQPQKRPLPVEEDDDDEEMLDTSSTVHSQPPFTLDDVLPKTKRRKMASEYETHGPGALPGLGVDGGEERFAHEEARSSHVPDPGSVALEENHDDEFDGYLDVRGTGKDNVDDGFEESTTEPGFRSLPLILVPRLPTIRVSTSLPRPSVPRNVASSERRNRSWSFEEPDGMEVSDDDGRKEQQKGTMVIYRPPFTLERSDLDEVAEGVRGMDLD